MLGSVQDKLNRVRPPRVKITYDVETLGAQEKIELPFIVGIFANLSGSLKRAGDDGGVDGDQKTLEPLAPVPDRKMVEVDPDTFEKVMESSKPAIDLLDIRNVLEKSPEEHLREKSKELNKDTAADADLVEIEDIEAELTDALGVLGSTEQQYLSFNKIDHFEPAQVIKRIKPLNAVYENRVALRELQAKSEMVPSIHDALSAYLPVKAEADDMKTAREGATTNLVSTFVTKFGLLKDALKQEKDARKLENPSKEMSAEDIQSWLDEQTAPKGGDESDADFGNRTGPLVAEDDEVLGSLFTQGALYKTETPTFRSYELMAAFANEVVNKLEAEHEAGLAATFDDYVAEIDKRLSRQLDEVLHNKDFQELEATWRGLAYLLNNTETSTTLKLRIMNVSKADLLDELGKAVEFDQSSIFKRIYEYEYGTYGGHPYSMLLGGYEFSRSPEDQKLLLLMSQIAAAAHAPFIASAYAELFDMESFENLAKPRDLSKIFESVELAQWQSFRESEDSRYVSLALPRVLFRLPWGGEKGQAVDIIDYEENVMNLELVADEKSYSEGDKTLRFREYSHTQLSSVNGSNMLWGNASWVLAQRVTNAHATFGWTAAIRGVEGGGLVDFLPTYTYKSADGDVDLVCPTQVSITDRREKELNDLGFMAICHCKGTAKAAFFGGQTTNLPKKYLLDAATANAKLSSQLPYMLCASRFAHYIKVMMRQKIGSFMTKDNVQKYLNNWIAEYILLDDEAPQVIKAKYPLRAANVVVTDNPAKPGSYNATVFLRPHFQLEELTTSIRLVAEIPG